VMRFQRNYLDQALCLCEKDPDFRWTIESSRLLKDYILHRPETDVQRMKAALQRGQMELMALDCQPSWSFVPLPNSSIFVRGLLNGRRSGISPWNVPCWMISVDGPQRCRISADLTA
ncbi:MAG: hypothetical protein J6T08_02200, partial [Lentisphaeria bacterium]|nr:hypothetical protein [Lentisphaeria bacterium]